MPKKEWEDLQGPALLVWNDSVFTEKDFTGIQQDLEARDQMKRALASMVLGSM